MSTSRPNARGRSPSRSGRGSNASSGTSTRARASTASASTSTSARTHPSAGPGGIIARRAARSPAFREKLRQMALGLQPLVQVTTGNVHPSFPRTLLGFWLLTEPELDEMARFYHQRTPGPHSAKYPCPITWGPSLTLDEKRRKIGKFIGLSRGCLTPIAVRSSPQKSLGASAALRPSWFKTEEQIEEDARKARVAADEDDAMKKKLHWYV
ncbi:hypothetical protein BN1708_006625 [Verticillium longisporum]|uniref:Uncharacterized protein n=1 Tax=Verticillium longisporum TaxID=100787 RepID=A0A0G4MLZ8_VERLO|nr:hypothetical protein BN1708_006625 [Verticillium longisporum]